MASKQTWKGRAIGHERAATYWRERAEKLEQMLYIARKEQQAAEHWAQQAEAAVADREKFGLDRP